MSLHKKTDDGTWVKATRPYVKRGGVWTGCMEAWVKVAGKWEKAFDFDTTPPDPPEITVNIVEDFNTVDGKKKLHSRWLRIGVRTPNVQNDEDIKLVRVLTTYGGKAPTTQFGGWYTSESDRDYPGEPWSEWRYNEHGPHNDTSKLDYKQWPRNSTHGDICEGNKDYFFSGWTLDDSGNWSAVTPVKIHVPKDTVDVPNVIVKEARFQANSSGSWRGDGFHSGNLIQRNNPRSRGLWFYGNQINDSVGQQTSGDEKVTVRSAQIFVSRMGPANDNGSANANIYLFWTPYGTVASLPGPNGSLTMHEPTKIGELAKGQAKWFKIPESFYGDLNKNINGMGLDWKAPNKAGAAPNDYSAVVNVAQNQRCGELHVVWEEEL